MRGVIVTIVAQVSGILRDTAPRRGDIWRKSRCLSYQSAAVGSLRVAQFVREVVSDGYGLQAWSHWSGRGERVEIRYTYWWRRDASEHSRMRAALEEGPPKVNLIAVFYGCMF